MTIPPINPETLPENLSTQTSTPQVTQLPTEIELLRAQVGQLTGLVQQMAANTQQQRQPDVPQYQPMQVHPDDWSDPSRAPSIMQEMIRREISQAVAPLDNFRKQYDRTNTYNIIKQQVRSSNPQISRFWNHIEPALDAVFGTGQIDVNPQIVLYQAQAVLGNIMLTNPSLLQAQPQAPAPSMIPPSGATPPTPPNPSQNLRPLTENESRIARERGLTHEQYLQMAEGSAIVITPKG